MSEFLGSVRVEARFGSQLGSKLGSGRGSVRVAARVGAWFGSELGLKLGSVRVAVRVAAAAGQQHSADKKRLNVLLEADHLTFISMFGLFATFYIDFSPLRVILILVSIFPRYCSFVVSFVTTFEGTNAQEILN